MGVRIIAQIQAGLAIGNILKDWWDKPERAKNQAATTDLLRESIDNGKLEQVANGLKELFSSFNVGGPALGIVISKIQSETLETRVKLMKTFIETLEKESVQHAIKSTAQVISNLLGLTHGLIDLYFELERMKKILQIGEEDLDAVIAARAIYTTPIGGPDPGGNDITDGTIDNPPPTNPRIPPPIIGGTPSTPPPGNPGVIPENYQEPPSEFWTVFWGMLLRPWW